MCEELRPQVDEVRTQVRTLKTVAEGTAAEQRNLGAAFRTQTEELRSAIAHSGSVGFWTYVVFLQFIFFAAFVMWRQSQNSRRHLL